MVHNGDWYLHFYLILKFFRDARVKLNSEALVIYKRYKQAPRAVTKVKTATMRKKLKLPQFLMTDVKNKFLKNFHINKNFLF